MSRIPPASDPAPQPINPFFGLVVLVASVFCVTTLSFVAAWFGAPDSPASRFLDRNGATLIAVEVAVVMVIGLLALGVDRKQTVRRLRESTRGHAAHTTDAAIGDHSPGSGADSADTGRTPSAGP